MWGTQKRQFGTSPYFCDNYRKYHVFTVLLLRISVLSDLSWCVNNVTTYLGHKDEPQDEGGANEESSAKDANKCIDKVFQRVGGDDGDCQYDACHICGCCNILGIV